MIVTWIEISLGLAGVQDAGMVAYRFNTIGVSDGISMGTDGMSFSLQSRDLIADSVETVMGGQWCASQLCLFPLCFVCLWRTRGIHQCNETAAISRGCGVTYELEPSS